MPSTQRGYDDARRRRESAIRLGYSPLAGAWTVDQVREIDSCIGCTVRWEGPLGQTLRIVEARPGCPAHGSGR